MPVLVTGIHDFSIYAWSSRAHWKTWMVARAVAMRPPTFALRKQARRSTARRGATMTTESKANRPENYGVTLCRAMHAAKVLSRARRLRARGSEPAKL